MPSDDNNIGEALTKPKPVETDMGVNPMWQPVRRLAR